jgi:hypothetical protein
MITLGFIDCDRETLNHFEMMTLVISRGCSFGVVSLGGAFRTVGGFWGAENGAAPRLVSRTVP